MDEDEDKIIELPWGNPLNLKWYKVSKGLADEIHEMMRIIYVSHTLSSACSCDYCKKIKEITNIPVFG